MSKAKITNIWIKYSILDNRKEGEIKLSWDNGRHHAVVIGHEHDNEAVAKALVKLAHGITRDHHLREPNDLNLKPVAKMQAT